MWVFWRDFGFFFGGLFVSIRVLLSVSITGDDKHLSTFFFFPISALQEPSCIAFPKH